MQLIGRPVLPPGICVICERSWQTGDKDWVDTLRHFDVGVVTFLTGKKVVCDSCAAEMAEKIGYVNPLEFARFVDKLGATENKQRELEARIKDLQVIEAALKRLVPDAPETE